MLNCEKPDGDYFRGYCHIYVSGIIDVQANFGLAEKDNEIRTCFPEGMNARQGAFVFVKWAKDNPELHHMPAFWGIVKSFYEAFPCKTP